MEIVPLTGGEKSGAEALRDGDRVGHLVVFATVQLGRRSTNLLASRFWPRRGFRPTQLRLRQDAQPTA